MQHAAYIKQSIQGSYKTMPTVRSMHCDQCGTWEVYGILFYNPNPKTDPNPNPRGKM